MKARRIYLFKIIGKEAGALYIKTLNHWDATNGYGQAWVMLQ